MSESAGKTFRGLQEAYSSIYSNESENLTEDTVVSEVQEEQEFEINEEALYESIKQYLIHEGFVNTEKQAENMVIHMSEEWMNDIVDAILTISEDFNFYINSLIQEGKDLSGHTWDELYEGYCSNAAENLNEAIPFAIPMISGGIGLLGGLANLAKGMQKRKPAPTGPSTWDYGQSGTSTYKPKPAATVKTDTAGDSPILGPTGEPIRKVPVTTSASEKPTAQPAAATGGPPPEPPKKDDKPEPPKDKDGILARLQRFGKEWQRQSAEKAANKAAEQAARQQAANKPPSGRMQAAVNTLQHPFTKGASATFAGSSLIGDLATGGTGTKKALGVPAGLVGGALYQAGRGTEALGLGPGVKTAGEKILKWSGWSNGKQKPAPKPAAATPSSRNPYGL